MPPYAAEQGCVPTSTLPPASSSSGRQTGRDHQFSVTARCHVWHILMPSWQNIHVNKNNEGFVSFDLISELRRVRWGLCSAHMLVGTRKLV